MIIDHYGWKFTGERMTKCALITGITGQDGSYLAEFLMAKGYEVHGLVRRSSSFNRGRIEHLCIRPEIPSGEIQLHYGDMTDSMSLTRVVQLVESDELYTFAAKSSVAMSFEEPEYTANTDALGTLRILKTARVLGLKDTTLFYQALVSEHTV